MLRQFSVLTALALVSTLATTPATAAAPDLSGFWKPAAPVETLRTTTGEAPPLTAVARKTYEQRLAAARAADRSFDNELQCRPPGVPRLMAESPFEIGQSDKEVAFLYQWNRLQRLVELRAHDDFDHVYPYYLGHPVGRWQGDTLLIDSIDFNDDTALDASGLPHSDALHVVEKLRLKDPNTLVDTITIEDPKTFTRAWETTLSYARLPADTRLVQDVCVERLGLKGLNTNKNRLPVAAPKKK
jgi:hypothetical protein